jgi:hypothetical protein
MGYSARYHAASLAAVFLALAIGIVIGVGLGQDVVESSTEGLEESLQEDVEEARAELDEREAELALEREFGVSIYPAIVEDRLARQRVGLIAIGDLSEEIAEDVELALRPTGANVSKVAVVPIPPDLDEVGGALDGRRDMLSDDPDDVEAFGERVGRQLASGGPLLNRAREQILTRFSGDAGPVDALIVVRDPPDEGASTEESELASRFESGLVGGLAAAPLEAVGVERSDTEPSSIGFFAEHELPTVDSIDLTSGKVAMVFALLGAEGNYGIKEEADRLLPDLLPPPPAGGGPERGGS